MSGSIRRKGLLKLLSGIAAGIAVVYYLIRLQAHGKTPGGFAMIGLGAPVAVGLVGLLEIAMNRPFSEMEQWWGGLRGWQRGVLGLLVVVLAFALLIGGMGTAGWLGLI